MAAPAHSVEADVSVLKCTFDMTTLSWQRDGSSCSAQLLCTAGGSFRLAVGNEEVPLSDVRSIACLGPGFMTLEAVGWGNLGLRCDDAEALRKFQELLEKRKADYERFERFDQSSVQSYFQYYSKLANQQNMLQDQVRTTTYRRAILENPEDFKGKVAMDIGAGSGILSFFAAQAGAEKVHAVEASSMAEVVQLLADANQGCFPGTSFNVLNKPLELVKDDEVGGKVDCLVSEPIGTFLFNERMIESYLCARDRFLKPGGKMFPNVGLLYIAPFSDPILHWEQTNKDGFWKNPNFYGLDLQAAMQRSKKEHMKQPVVDYINPECLASQASVTRFDFAKCSVESLKHMEFPFDFEIHQPCLIHGLAGWFDCVFEGSNTTVTLSTAPWCPGTHWYQIRFMLETPLALNAGQRVEGLLTMDANSVQSYYMKMKMRIQGTEIFSEAPHIDLKDPEYRFFSSQNTYIPPGTPGFGSQQAPQGQWHTTGQQPQPQQQQQQPQPQQQAYQQMHWAQSQMAPPSAPPQVSQGFVSAGPDGPQVQMNGTKL
mmetsp:Transcript_55036/g.117456  ORF Transcript_55036/g.117456 Transcript_55036/m.117456 type:complete len:542 (-) Transcript_55036:185-1810(-)